jgi:hypothetical protein
MRVLTVSQVSFMFEGAESNTLVCKARSCRRCEQAEWLGEFTPFISRVFHESAELPDELLILYDADASPVNKKMWRTLGGDNESERADEPGQFHRHELR